MSNKQNDVAVGNAFSAQQAAEESYYERMESKKQFYLELSRKFCPDLTLKTPDEIRLKELLHKIKRTIGMLKCFDCPWENGMPVIQNTCFTFLTADNIPKAERMECIRKWSDWTTFLLGASRYRTLIPNLLRRYYVQLRDLERLVGREPTPFPEMFSE